MALENFVPLQDEKGNLSQKGALARGIEPQETVVVSEDIKPTESKGALSTTMGINLADTVSKSADAYKELLDILKRRQQGYSGADPLWALTAGLLKPTQAGSFAESVGQGLEGYQKARKLEDEEILQNAKMRAELVSKEQEAVKQGQALTLLSNALDLPGNQVTQVMANGFLSNDMLSKLSPSLIGQLKILSKPIGDAAESIFKNNIELRKVAVEEQKAGITDAEFIAKWGVSYKDLLPGGKMSTVSADGKPIEGKGGDGAAAGATTTGGQPLAVDIERKTERAKVAGKGEGERESAFFDKVRSADDRIVLGNNLYTTVSQNKNAVGLLQSPGIANAIGKFFQEGVQAGQFGSFNIPVEELLRVGGKKATPENIRAAELIKSYVTQLTLEAQKDLYKGQGAVTENERRLAQTMTGSASNTAEFLKYSAAKVIVNAEFDKRYAEAFNKVKKSMSYDDFIQSKPYKDIRAEQNQRLLDLSNNAISSVGLKPSEPTLADKLNQEKLRRKTGE